jgi:uncharacterized damage-inducible protein DinB
MPSDPSSVEQAVSRTLRDNLERLQRTAKELDEAVSDLVSACASSRPTNALSPMIRAQTAAASLVSTMDILSRFVTSSLQPGPRTVEQEAPLAVEEEKPVEIVVPAPAPVAEESQAIQMAPPEPVVELEERRPPEPIAVEETPPPAEELAAPSAPPLMAPPEPERVEAMASGLQENVTEQPSAVEAAPQALLDEPVPLPEFAVEPESEPMPPEAASFDLTLLPLEEQELHRRANRVAKVSMQDIKMLRPEDVALGRAHKDLCLRLREDIEKAYREYDRRFQSILGHPVDYFYDWMVEILGGGDPTALGEYPFPTAAVRH